jgi:hypothetical protein
MRIRLLSIVSVLTLLRPCPAMCQAAHPQGPPNSQHSIVPLTQEGALKSRERGFEVVSGDPDKAGAPFVIRIYNVENQIIPPHYHPEDEHLTVVKGSWSIGDGDTFDKNALHEMNVGDYVEVPKTMRHFGWAKTAVVVQIHGIGPFKQINVDPWMFLSDSNAASKFKYKLHDRVRSKRGEGVVMFGVTSEKNRITQYIVQRHDGSVFAEFEEELAKVG